MQQHLIVYLSAAIFAFFSPRSFESQLTQIKLPKTGLVPLLSKTNFPQRLQLTFTILNITFRIIYSI